MALQRHEREVEGITILALQGRLILGADSKSLRVRVSTLLEGGKKSIILDMKEVEFIDSTGLGTLVIAHSETEKAGGAMKLLHLSKRHIELLVLTKLSTLFEVFDDEQDAINSFFPDREVRHFDILEFVKSHEDPEPETA